MLLGLKFIKLLFRIKLCNHSALMCYFLTCLYGFMFLKTLCFTNQMFHVRNIPIRSYTINKITFIITTITTIIIIIIVIIIIFNFNITIIIIIITIIIKSTIIIILSFVLYFFDIRSLCVTFIFEFIFIFLTTCFLLCIGFRCNILLTNNSNYLLL